ncbi:4-aminobutyrate aminotransferase family protein [Opitutaceae bacterium TAV1]|nr:4-aminobutyrate aminotransferase family protein [Opitutaceae bacterium TAV1]
MSNVITSTITSVSVSNASGDSLSETALASLNYPEAPLIRTAIPGPRALDHLERARQVESMARGAGGFPFVFAAGRGSTVKDADGNIAIDVSAGVAVNAVGRCHPRVVAAMKAQMDVLMHASDMSSTHRTALAEKVAAVMPPGLRDNCVTCFTQSGSNAAETALKFIRALTGRGQIVAFHGAYHGVSTGCGSLTTGERYHKKNLHIPGVIHVPYPYSYRCPFGTRTQEECEEMCANYLDYVLNTPYTGADDVAAVIVEPIQGEGGYVPPSAEFFRRVKAACEKHGALFVADEVQAGAGRSGKMWAIEYSGVEPDVLLWGKGMGGDVAMAGCTFRRDLALKIGEGSHPNTFAANGVSAAACMTNIDIITENNGALLDRVATVGREIVERLRAAIPSAPWIGEVRGRGFMIGIELVANPDTREPLPPETVSRIVMKMLARGIILVPCGRHGNVLRFMPPLTITRALVNTACDTLLECLREVSAGR